MHPVGGAAGRLACRATAARKLRWMRPSSVLAEVPAIDVDYLEVRDSALGPAPASTAPAGLLVAARLGKTRLLDNVGIEIATTVGVDGRVPAATAESRPATMWAAQRSEEKLGNQPLESHWRN